MATKKRRKPARKARARRVRTDPRQARADARRVLLGILHGVVRYWDEEPRAKTTRERLDGVAFGILMALEGRAAGMPALRLLTDGEDDMPAGVDLADPENPLSLAFLHHNPADAVLPKWRSAGGECPHLSVTYGKTPSGIPEHVRVQWTCDDCGLEERTAATSEDGDKWTCVCHGAGAWALRLHRQVEAEERPRHRHSCECHGRGAEAHGRHTESARRAAELAEEEADAKMGRGEGFLERLRRI